MKGAKRIKFFRQTRRKRGREIVHVLPDNAAHEDEFDCWCELEGVEEFSGGGIMVFHRAVTWN